MPLLSQSAPLVAGSTALFSYVQNVDRTRARGIELVARTGTMCCSAGPGTDGQSHCGGCARDRNAAFPAFDQQIHQPDSQTAGQRHGHLPAGRQWSFTAGARYGDRSFGTLDNSDFVSQTYQGFAGYFVVDARVRYKWDEHWARSVGCRQSQQ